VLCSFGQPENCGCTFPFFVMVSFIAATFFYMEISFPDVDTNDLGCASRSVTVSTRFRNWWDNGEDEDWVSMSSKIGVVRAAVSKCSRGNA